MRKPYMQAHPTDEPEPKQWDLVVMLVLMVLILLFVVVFEPNLSGLPEPS